MNIYLDTCVLQRPLDTKNQLRIALESEAALGLLSLWESGQIKLVFSDAHIDELLKITNRIKGLKIRVISPLDLIKEIEK